MPADPSTRMPAFMAFVRRALDRAKAQQGWSVQDVAAAAGISANAIYLWRSGQGTSFPLGESVEAFCDALRIKPADAFEILWPGKDGPAGEPLPLGPDEDLLTLARKLEDPALPPLERFLIRETIHGLAARPSN